METLFIIAKLEEWLRAYFFGNNLANWQLKMLLKQGRCWWYVKHASFVASIYKWFGDIWKFCL